jgi:hypothetical protein
MLIAERSSRPGHVVLLREYEYPAVGATDESELNQYLEYLEQQKFIERFEGGGLCLTIPGWQKVEPRIVGGSDPGRCFVAMWFDDSMDSIYENGFAKGIEDAGFRPFLIKQTSTNKGISDAILAQIRISEFVVADFTRQRQSVYFEAGFAKGLGKEVIWCCRNTDVKKLHFDTKHLGHVVWKDANDLRRRLADSIRANIVRPA